MQLHQLQRRTKLKKMNRIGRGTTRGKTSGRGTKGQNARAGHRKRPELRDIIKKIPKLRGRGVNIFQSFQTPFQVVNLGSIETHFKDGDTVTPKTLREHGLVKNALARVKILGDGALTKTVTFGEVSFSASAKQKLGMAADAPKVVAVKKISPKTEETKTPKKTSSKKLVKKAK